VHDEHNEVDIGCDDHHAALDLLDGHPAVAAAYATPDGIRVTLSGSDGVASVNARLVTGGVLVSRLEPVRESLEQRFLEMTSRVGGES
jgi:ABC-2 type transport system ATP-binding protein